MAATPSRLELASAIVRSVVEYDPERLHAAIDAVLARYEDPAERELVFQAALAYLAEQPARYALLAGAIRRRHHP
ncbi:MAG TPA: hypothetical protein VE777_01950 [Gaiellales bacterium]|jgi:hypothetical protein|nr:hypothetical protein [Gaiellales bacterium]